MRTTYGVITATLNADSIRRSDLKEGQEVNFPIAKLINRYRSTLLDKA